MDPITGLAYGRIAVGTLSLLSPRLAAKALLLDPGQNRQVPYVTRLFGSREIALGAITLASTGAARRSLVQVGMAVDGADAFTGLVGTVSGAVPRRSGLMMAVVAAGAVVTGASSFTRERLTSPLGRGCDVVRGVTTLDKRR